LIAKEQENLQLSSIEDRERKEKQDLYLFTR